MRFLPAVAGALLVSCAAPPPSEPVGTSLPSAVPQPSPSPAASQGAPPAGSGVLRVDVQRQCGPLITAFATAKKNDPGRPTKKVLDAVFDDAPPMESAKLEWCRREMTRLLE